MQSLGWLRAILETGLDASSSARRRHRVNTVLLTCELGSVVNLSQTGMRVRAERGAEIIPGKRDLRLRFDDDEVMLTARLVWQSRTSDGALEMGLEFVDLSEEQSRSLARLARGAMDCEVLRPRAGSA